MNKQELAKEVYKVAYLTGTFKLRSGQTSNHYFDKYRFEANPKLLAAVAAQMATLIPKDTEILAGLEMGGIPVATALSLHTGLPLVFVRKKAKDYGTCKFAEGLEIKNKKLCIIEDVITTGGQVLLSAKDLRDSGAIVTNILCVIDRSTAEKPAGPIFTEQGLKLFSVFTASELMPS